MSKYTDKIDMRFKYVPSGKTDVAATFRRFRAQSAELAEKQKAAEQEAQTKVRKTAK